VAPVPVSRFFLLLCALLLLAVNLLMAESARRDWIVLVLGAAVFVLGVVEMVRAMRTRGRDGRGSHR
jgi:uncharacterized membrane protein HdeD (DUF308 family)